MITVLICIILGVLLGSMVENIRKPGRDAHTGTAYCRSCGNAPGYHSTAACYDCVDYNNWVRHEG